jgi:hypothetical protein
MHVIMFFIQFIHYVAFLIEKKLITNNLNFFFFHMNLYDFVMIFDEGHWHGMPLDQQQQYVLLVSLRELKLYP